MPHKLREKYLNSDFEANSKNKYEARIKRENIEELISLLFAFLLSIGYCHAQWTELDSLKLKGLLEKEGEIELNPDALRSIVGLHHFTNENTLCLCRKRIYELMVE